MQVQIREYAPTIAIDSTDGCMCYLSKTCAENPDFSITSAKSSEMNISFPHGDDEEYVERPLCEQFKFKVNPKSGAITATESDIYSG
jgi:adenylyl cyclase-associated protein